MSLALLKLTIRHASYGVSHGCWLASLGGNRLNNQFAESVDSPPKKQSLPQGPSEHWLHYRSGPAWLLQRSRHSHACETLNSSLTSGTHPMPAQSLDFESQMRQARRKARLVLDGLRSGGDDDTIGALRNQPVGRAHRHHDHYK